MAPETVDAAAVASSAAEAEEAVELPVSVGVPADSWSDTRVMVTQSICKSRLD